MDGATALKFARSRHSSQDGSDFARSQRQKNVILAVKEKVLQLNFLPKLVPFIAPFQDFRTDLSFEDLQALIQKQDEYQTYEIRNIALSDQNVLRHSRSQNEQYILVPLEGEGNWNSVHAWLSQQLQDENPEQALPATPSAAPDNQNTQQ